MKRYLFIVALAFSGAVQSAAVTIDFEEFALGTATNSVAGTGYPPPLQSQGFDIGGQVAESGPFSFSSSVVYIAVGESGTKSLVGSVSGGAFSSEYGNGVYFSLNRSDRGAFALYDFDFYADNNFSTSVIGHTVGGGTVNLSTALGTGGWLNLEYVDFFSSGAAGVFVPSYASGQLDNIVVSAVPIPGAVWLFGSGLGLLGFLRRWFRLPAICVCDPRRPFRLP